MGSASGENGGPNPAASPNDGASPLPQSASDSQQLQTVLSVPGSQGGGGAAVGPAGSAASLFAVKLLHFEAHGLRTSVKEPYLCIDFDRARLFQTDKGQTVIRGGEASLNNATSANLALAPDGASDNQQGQELGLHQKTSLSRENSRERISEKQRGQSRSRSPGRQRDDQASTTSNNHANERDGGSGIGASSSGSGNTPGQAVFLGQAFSGNASSNTPEAKSCVWDFGAGFTYRSSCAVTCENRGPGPPCTIIDRTLERLGLRKLRIFCHEGYGLEPGPEGIFVEKPVEDNQNEGTIGTNTNDLATNANAPGMHSLSGPSGTNSMDNITNIAHGNTNPVANIVMPSDSSASDSDAARAMGAAELGGAGQNTNNNAGEPGSMTSEHTGTNVNTEPSSGNLDPNETLKDPKDSDPDAIEDRFDRRELNDEDFGKVRIRYPKKSATQEDATGGAAGGAGGKTGTAKEGKKEKRRKNYLNNPRLLGTAEVSLKALVCGPTRLSLEMVNVKGESIGSVSFTCILRALAPDFCIKLRKLELTIQGSRSPGKLAFFSTTRGYRPAFQENSGFSTFFASPEIQLQQQQFIQQQLQNQGQSQFAGGGIGGMIPSASSSSNMLSLKKNTSNNNLSGMMGSSGNLNAMMGSGNNAQLLANNPQFVAQQQMQAQQMQLLGCGTTNSSATFLQLVHQEMVQQQIVQQQMLQQQMIQQQLTMQQQHGGELAMQETIERLHNVLRASKCLQVTGFAVEGVWGWGSEGYDTTGANERVSPRGVRSEEERERTRGASQSKGSTLDGNSSKDGVIVGSSQNGSKGSVDSSGNEGAQGPGRDQDPPPDWIDIQFPTTLSNLLNIETEESLVVNVLDESDESQGLVEIKFRELLGRYFMEHNQKRLGEEGFWDNQLNPKSSESDKEDGQSGAALEDSAEHEFFIEEAVLYGEEGADVGKLTGYVSFANVPHFVQMLGGLITEQGVHGGILLCMGLPFHASYTQNNRLLPPVWESPKEQADRADREQAERDQAEKFALEAAMEEKAAMESGPGLAGAELENQIRGDGSKDSLREESKESREAGEVANALQEMAGGQEIDAEEAKPLSSETLDMAPTRSASETPQITPTISSRPDSNVRSEGRPGTDGRSGTEDARSDVTPLQQAAAGPSLRTSSKWEERTCSKTGKSYFADVVTKKTTWVDPRNMPLDWTLEIDETDGKPYFVYWGEVATWMGNGASTKTGSNVNDSGASAPRTLVDPRTLPSGWEMRLARAAAAENETNPKSDSTKNSGIPYFLHSQSGRSTPLDPRKIIEKYDEGSDPENSLSTTTDERNDASSSVDASSDRRSDEEGGSSNASDEDSGGRGGEGPGGEVGIAVEMDEQGRPYIEDHRLKGSAWVTW